MSPQPPAAARELEQSCTSQGRELKFDSIHDKPGLTQLCASLRDSQWIGFDTEFVSEYSYYPDLCLVQVVADNGVLAVIDTKEIQEIDEFWRTLSDGDHLTIVHAGREEFRFCRRAVGAVPKHWFDVQLAAGMVGLDWPSAYGKLINRCLRLTLGKGETRTDWRRRPLTEGQLEYALQDVIHLPDLYSYLNDKLIKLGRTDWLVEETATWIDDVLESENRERWRRVSGLSKLPARAQVIAKELWRWRENQAQQRDVQPRRVLRDDLLVELARRGKTRPEQLKEIRGIQRRDIEPHLSDIAECIRSAKNMKPERQPRSSKPVLPTHVDMLTQFLGAALTSVCRGKSIAPNLVGTAQDVRELIADHLGCDAVNGGPPKLGRGWRAEIVGQQIHDVLDGKLALRITDPNGPAPLRFEGDEEKEEK